MALRLKDPKKIKHFQKSHGLKVTGRLDSATTRKIRVHNSNAKPAPSSSPAQTAPKDPLAGAVRSAVRLKYQQPETDLRKQIQGSDMQSARVGSWYDNYVNEVKAAQQNAQQGYNDAANRISTEAQTADTADRQGTQQLASQMQADAAARGASVDPAIQARAQQAASARRLGIESMLAQTATQGANANTAMAGRAAVGVGAKANALVAEQNRKAALTANLSDLRLQKGDYGQQVHASLAKDLLNQQIADQTFNLHAGQLQVNQQNAQTSASAARSLDRNRRKTFKQTQAHQAHQDSTAQQNANTNRYRATHPKAPAKPKPKAEPAASHAFKHKVDTYTSNIKRLRAGGLTAAEAQSTQGKALGFKAGQRLSGPQISAWARAHGADETVLNIARDIVYHGYVTGPNLAALRRAGVRVPKAWKTRPRKITTVGGVASTAAGALGIFNG